MQTPESEPGQALDGALAELQSFGASSEDLDKAQQMQVGESINGISAKGSWSLSREGENRYNVQTDGESESPENV